MPSGAAMWIPHGITLDTLPMTQRAATQYAMLTATFGLTRAIASKAGGYIAQFLGYPTFFWSTVFFGIPALFLLLLVKNETSVFQRD